MDINTFSIVVAILTAISASAERLVEIVQNILGGFGAGIKEQSPDPRLESWRRLLILAISFGCCYVTALLALEILPEVKGVKWKAESLGLLAMGGSSFWNSIQGYLNGIKNSVKPIGDAVDQATKKFSDAQKKKDEAATVADPAAKEKLLAEAEVLIKAANDLLASIGNKKA